MNSDLHIALGDAARLIRERRFAEAGAVGDQLLQAFPGHADILYLKACCCQGLGEIAGCLKWTRLTLAANPANAPARDLLGAIYQQPQFRWLQFFYAQPVDLVLDVGGNIGEFGLELRRTGYEGRILSVEPVPSALAKLNALRTGDAGWDAAELALGRVPGSLSINVAANDAASSSLLPMSARHLKAAPESRTIDRREVAVDTLDHFFGSLPDRGATRLLKLDTQGYEAEILAGGGAVLPSFALVHVELSVAPLYEGQALIHDVLATLHRSGFELIDLQPYMFEPSTGHLLQLNGTLRNIRL